MQSSSLDTWLLYWPAKSPLTPHSLTRAQFSPHLTCTAHHHCNWWLAQYCCERSWWRSPYGRLCFVLFLFNFLIQPKWRPKSLNFQSLLLILPLLQRRSAQGEAMLWTSISYQSSSLIISSWEWGVDWWSKRQDSRGVWRANSSWRTKSIH